MAFSSNVLPELFTWNIDNKPIALPTNIVVPVNGIISCSIVAENTPAIPAEYKISMSAATSLGSWQIQITLVGESRVDIITSAEAVGSAWSKEIPMMHSGSIKAYVVSFKNVGTAEVKLQGIELRPSIALDAQTAEAIEQVLPSVQVFQSTEPINVTGTANHYGFEVTTTRSTSLIAHILLTCAANASGLGTAKVLYNGVESTIGTMYFPITARRITTTLVVPLVSIPDGSTLIEIQFEGDVPYVIPTGGLLVSVDGKYLSSKGTTNPSITVADVITVDVATHPAISMTDQVMEVSIQKPIQIVVSDSIPLTCTNYVPIQVTDSWEFTHDKIYDS